MSHHEHDPMKGHHRPTTGKGRTRWWRLITRSNETDEVVRSEGLPYPGIGSYVSGHEDAPVSTRARALWWLTGIAIVAATIVVVVTR
jgi:hypothetical protein